MHWDRPPPDEVKAISDLYIVYSLSLCWSWKRRDLWWGTKGRRDRNVCHSKSPFLRVQINPSCCRKKRRIGTVSLRLNSLTNFISRLWKGMYVTFNRFTFLALSPSPLPFIYSTRLLMHTTFMGVEILVINYREVVACVYIQTWLDFKLPLLGYPGVGVGGGGRSERESTQ